VERAPAALSSRLAVAPSRPEGLVTLAACCGGRRSWFAAGNPTKTTSTSYKKDCLSCHVPAQATDWVYTSGYPTLK